MLQRTVVDSMSRQKMCVCVCLFAVMRTTHNLKNRWATSSLRVKFRYICYRMYVMWPSPSEQTARLIKTLPPSHRLPSPTYPFIISPLPWRIPSRTHYYENYISMHCRQDLKYFSFFFPLPSNSMFFIIKKNPCSCCWPALSSWERALEKIKENSFHQRYYLQPRSKPGYTPDRKCTWGYIHRHGFYSSTKCKISS